MSGPMEGIRVLELGVWVAAPSAAAILADWGAEVIKLETAAGDPMRGVFLTQLGPGLTNPPFELDNRGKRSLAVDLRQERGRALALELVDRADVFVTNLRPGALERMGLDGASLRERNPRLVYAGVTGFGDTGDERDRASYDVGAFWARAGVAANLTLPEHGPAMQRGGMGDHMAGLAAASGIAAALFHRERTGEGQIVSTSLLRVGIYMMGWDTSVTLRTGKVGKPVDRATPPNPILNPYATSDGRWVWLLGLEADRHWHGVATALGHPEWVDDPRFATLQDRWTNNAELTDLMVQTFAARPLVEWREALDRHGVWWAPVQSTDEVVADPQAAAAGAWVEVPDAAGGAPTRGVATPVDFSATPWQPRSLAPEVGQHTEEILLELGRDWDAITALKDDGIIP